MDITKVITKELVEELSKREGVQSLTVDNNAYFEVSIESDWEGQEQRLCDRGSAIVFVVVD